MTTTAPVRQRPDSISRRSPLSPEELASLGDEELLAYINEWDSEHHDQDDWLVQIDY